jgi:hypothetical protein
VRRLCFDLSYLRLTQLKTGELCTLDEFVAAGAYTRSLLSST